VSLEILFEEQSESNDPPETQLHQRKFLYELAIGVSEKIILLDKPINQLKEVFFLWPVVGFLIICFISRNKK